MTGILATFVEYVIGALNNINSTIDRSIELSTQRENRIMAAIDDLKTSVSDLGTSISSELTAIADALKAIPPTGTSDADIEAVVASVQALKTKVDAETAALAPPPPPPPADPTPTA